MHLHRVLIYIYVMGFGVFNSHNEGWFINLDSRISEGIVGNIDFVEEEYSRGSIWVKLSKYLL